MIVAVLAGGQSKRFGTDKAEAVFRGRTLLKIAIDAAQQARMRVLVVGRHGTQPEVGYLMDDHPGLGPIGGLRTALRHTMQPLILCGCDMPLLNAQAFQALAGQYEARQNVAGIVTMNITQPEPLFSLYTPQLLPLVEQQIERGDRSMVHLIAITRMLPWPPPAHVLQALQNTNTPEELAALK